MSGFSRFTPNPADRIATSETTTSSSYANLATAGPTLTGLPSGRYVVMFGFTGGQAAGTTAFMGVEVNAVAASDDEAAKASVAGPLSVMTCVSKTLTAGSNSITAKYKQTGGGTGTFAGRWLVAFRYSNT